MKNIIARCALLAATAFTLSGCVSSKYKLAKPEEIKPAAALQLMAHQPPIEAAVHSVIVFQGPGSWKREAYWDEYGVTITNRGTSTLTVESATLTGRAGTTLSAGTLPWALEKQSRSLASRNFDLALDTTAHLGSGVGAFSVGVALGSLAGGSGWAALGGAVIGGAVAIPAYIGGSIYRNITSRHAIEREFDRRRLVLPVNLVSAQTAPGSLFFPVTPGPKSLTLRYRVADEVHDLTVDLAQLAGLHLKSTHVVPHVVPHVPRSNP